MCFNELQSIFLLFIYVVNNILHVADLVKASEHSNANLTSLSTLPARTTLSHWECRNAHCTAPPLPNTHVS